MTFKDSPYGVRRLTLGDIAESQFEERSEVGFHRFGLKRPPIKLNNIPSLLLRAPDYLRHDSFVEVVGVGRDQTLKIHIEKIDALNFWQTLFPVALWIWDSSKKRCVEVPWADVVAAVHGGHAELGHFHDGGAYFALKVQRFFE